MFSKISGRLLHWINRTEPDLQHSANSINNQPDAFSPQPEDDTKVDAGKNGDCYGADLEDKENKESLQEGKKEIEVGDLIQNEKGDKNEGGTEHEKEFEVVWEGKLDRNRTTTNPVRPDAKDCSFYLRTGLCKFGMNCKFNHPPGWKPQVGKVKEKEESVDSAVQEVKEKDDSKAEQIKCFDCPGGCKPGKARKVNHRAKTTSTVELNFMGLPVRPGEKDCSYYMQHGSCKFGENCRFSHPDPTTVGGYDNQSVDSNERSVLSPNSSQSTLGSWSVAALSESPPYVPLILPSTQVVPSDPEWHSHGAMQRQIQEAIASPSYEGLFTKKCVGQNLVINVPKSKIKQPKAIQKKQSASQKVRCELCKVECTSIQLYANHLAGKKHTNNFQKLHAQRPMSPAAQASQSVDDSCIASEMGTLSGKGMAGVMSVVTDLERKKLKLLEGGITVQSLRVCTICNVVCNGEIAFAEHLMGKKHLTQEGALATQDSSNPPLATSPKPKSAEERTTKPKNGESLHCEVICTRLEDLVIHQHGKKHKKKLKKPQNPPKTVDPTAPPPSSGQAKEPEDVETKKQKVLEHGAAPDAVRTCTICNVVCNSKTVFNSHVAGQKHAAMVKRKQTEEEATGKILAD